MKCVFLRSDGKCLAEMLKQAGSTVGWEVDEETKERFCTKDAFLECPRYEAKMAFLTKSR
jgi:hypothetical protein